MSSEIHTPVRIGVHKWLLDFCILQVETARRDGFIIPPDFPMDLLVSPPPSSSSSEEKQGVQVFTPQFISLIFETLNELGCEDIDNMRVKHYTFVTTLEGEKGYGDPSVPTLANGLIADYKSAHLDDITEDELDGIFIPICRESILSFARSALAQDEMKEEEKQHKKKSTSSSSSSSSLPFPPRLKDTLDCVALHVKNEEMTEIMSTVRKYFEERASSSFSASSSQKEVERLLADYPSDIANQAVEDLLGLITEDLDPETEMDKILKTGYQPEEWIEFTRMCEPGAAGSKGTPLRQDNGAGEEEEDEEDGGKTKTKASGMGRLSESIAEKMERARAELAAAEEKINLEIEHNLVASPEEVGNEEEEEREVKREKKNTNKAKKKIKFEVEEEETDKEDEDEEKEETEEEMKMEMEVDDDEEEPKKQHFKLATPGAGRKKRRGGASPNLKPIMKKKKKSIVDRIALTAQSFRQKMPIIVPKSMRKRQKKLLQKLENINDIMPETQAQACDDW